VNQPVVGVTSGWVDRVPEGRATHADGPAFSPWDSGTDDVHEGRCVGRGVIEFPGPHQP